MEESKLKNTPSAKQSREEQFRKAAAIAEDAIKKIGSPLNIGSYMLSVAVDREAPLDVQGVIELFGRDVLDEKLMKTFEDGEKHLNEIVSEDVSIQSLDGLKLVGHVVRAKKQKRVILAFHGWRGGWAKDLGMIADFWRDNGCTVVYVEQRAQGNSEGEYISFGIYERFDCLNWIEWAGEYFGRHTPVYLAGVSMGASTVLMACGQKLPDYVKGCIADCGFTSTDEIWRHVASDCLHLIYPANMLRSLCKEKLHFDPTKHTTLEAMAKATVPILFVHGEEDHFVPREMTLENYEACVSDKMIMLSPGAEHGLSYYMEPERYQDYMMRFFERFH
ncbi:MAG: alpha/beta hydrolase [Firmicutes bacterium]|nr:alpha/beta hydrolase [Bacillota bacterium]